MFGRGDQAGDLGRELHELLRDIEELVRVLGPEQADTLAAIRESLGPRIEATGAQLRERTRAARAWLAGRRAHTRRLTHRHPWRALWIAGATGALLGASILRARRRDA